MPVTSIRIKEQKRKALKVIASVEGKTMSSLMEDLIDDYISKNKEKYARFLDENNSGEFMKMSETTFSEWDNEEDEIYNNI